MCRTHQGCICLLSATRLPTGSAGCRVPSPSGGEPSFCIPPAHILTEPWGPAGAGPESAALESTAYKLQIKFIPAAEGEKKSKKKSKDKKRKAEAEVRQQGGVGTARAARGITLAGGTAGPGCRIPCHGGLGSPTEAEKRCSNVIAVPCLTRLGQVRRESFTPVMMHLAASPPRIPCAAPTLDSLCLQEEQQPAAGEKKSKKKKSKSKDE